MRALHISSTCDDGVKLTMVWYLGAKLTSIGGREEGGAGRGEGQGGGRGREGGGAGRGEGQGGGRGVDLNL